MLHFATAKPLQTLSYWELTVPSIIGAIANGEPFVVLVFNADSVTRPDCTDLLFSTKLNHFRLSYSYCYVVATSEARSNLGAINAPKRADGSSTYTAQIRISRAAALVHSEAQTFERRPIESAV